MSHIKLDLKMFKHKSSDGKTTTLEHVKDKHTITLAHDALSKPAQEQLKALSQIATNTATPPQKQESAAKMADGGKVADNQTPVDEFLTDPPKPEKIPTKPHESVAQKQLPAPTHPKHLLPIHRQSEATLIKSEKHGDIKRKMAEGGDVEHECEGAKFCMHCGGAMQHYDEGGNVAPAALSAAQQPASQDPADVALQSAGIQSGGKDEDMGPNPQQVEQDKFYDAAAQSSIPVRERGFMGTPEAIVPTMEKVRKGEAEFNPEIAKVAEAQRKQSDLDKQTEQSKSISDAQAYNQMAKQYGLAEKPVPGAPPASQAYGDQSSTTPPASSLMPPTAAASSSAPGAPDQMDLENLGKTVGAGIQAAGQQAPILKAQGQAEAAAAQSKMQMDMDNKAHFDSVIQDLDKDRMHTIEDIRNGYIDPQQYWTGHKDPQTGEMVGGHSKLMAGIGMILAGFNPTSNPNAAINMLKYQMDQNLTAQAKNLDSKHNLLRANLDQFKNVRDAADFTRLQISDITQAELLKAAANAKSQGAGLAAKMAAGQLAQQALPISQALYMRRALGSLGQAGGSPEHEAQALGHMMIAAPEVYKEMQPKFVPGLGFADNPVPQATRDKIQDHRDFDMHTKNLQDFVASHGGVWNRLSPSDRAQAMVLAQPIQALFRSTTLGTVFRESEAPLINKAQSSDPLAFTQLLTGERKLSTLRKVNQDTFGNLQDSLGGSIAMRHRQAAQQQPAQPQGQAVKGKDGKMYVPHTINGKQYMVPQP